MPSPIIIWFRRDLRLADHDALDFAAQSGRPVIPIFICDDQIASLGAAAKWRFGLGVDVFAKSLEKIGSRLILRKGAPSEVLLHLVKETGATSVVWSRSYDPSVIDGDKGVKSCLLNEGLEAKSFKGHLLFEPWAVENKQGSHFKVYTPFWRHVSQRLNFPQPLAKIEKLVAPQVWPESDELENWNLGRDMHRGASIVAKHVCVGEEAAQDRLAQFVDGPITSYKEARDFPSIEATSRLSENFTYGEISVRSAFFHAQRALEIGARGAEHFMKEIVWREFAYHLLWNFPQLAEKPWRSEWSEFEWDGESALTLAWKQGLTGEPFVDAGMRELYVTGTMHNRLRMIVGSYLTKNMISDWRIGLKWFEDCLIDWDPAANAMGWQWIAGCGPDAAPYFRVFNPALQAEKFDKDSLYRDKWLDIANSKNAQDFLKAVPLSWALSNDLQNPEAAISLKSGRDRALAAYKAFKSQ